MQQRQTKTRLTMLPENSKMLIPNNEWTTLRAWRRSKHDTALRLFLTCWLIYVLHFATNTVREIYPALSLGDHLSFDVSEYAGLHPDIFELPGRGTFINNNPGASILGAIPYIVTRPAIEFVVQRIARMRAVSAAPPPDYNTIYPMAREFYRQAYARGIDVKFGLAAGVMQALLMAPLSALSVVVIFSILVRAVASVRVALLLALLYALATPVFYRTAQLNHNLLVSHFALFAFFLLWQAGHRTEDQRNLHYGIAGLLCGWTVVLDYSGVIVVLVLSLYALLQWTSLPPSSRNRLDLARFAGGVGCCSLLLMAYQWYYFGHPIYPAQHYMPATQYSGYGYQGMDWPQLDLLWELAFGIRYGLFTSAPLLLLTLYLPAWFSQRIRLVGRLEIGLILFFTVAFFLFTAANQFSRMQFNSGIRHIIPVTPFLFLIAAGVLLRLPAVVAMLFGVAVTYWSWCLAMYRDVEQGWGIFESLRHITVEGVRLPWLTTAENLGYAPEGVWAAPLLVISGIIICVIWTIAPHRIATILLQWSWYRMDS